MRRKSILFTFPSLILLSILFSVLGLDMIQHGGRAFSPGELSTSGDLMTSGKFATHAEFENECVRCHQPLQVRQGELCLQCHVEIADEIRGAVGSHGAIESALACYECHSDHNGKDFDPIKGAMEKFDHSIASFNLRWHQIGYDTLPMSCDDCHTTAPEFSFFAETCEGCHITNQKEFMEQHKIDFGRNCIDCHDGIDRMIDFDHQNTNFPLDGEHLKVPCAGCHQEADFENTATGCSDCHLEPAEHLNQFDPDCSACHNTLSWSPALLDGQSFEHASVTAFSLAHHHVDYSGDVLACLDCHSQTGYEISTNVCLACHSSEAPGFMDEHTGLFGGACLDCHDGVDRLSDFDHDARFALQGRHAEIECESCHGGKVFRGTPVECVRCHDEPEIHAGFFGLKCEYCHSADAWTPAHIRIHIFPMDHGNESGSDCQLCHIQVYQEYTCYGCHDHQPEEITEIHQALKISPEDLTNCAKCHPSGEIGPVDE
jgi:hypothetical protein